jgi:hypothetical protein
MYRSAFSSFAALAIALALAFPILSNAQRDNEDATEAGAENSPPTEEPCERDAMPDVRVPDSLHLLPQCCSTRERHEEGCWSS